MSQQKPLSQLAIPNFIMNNGYIHEMRRKQLGYRMIDLRRNDDQFFCERVGQGSGQQSAKAVGEEIGAISAVQVQSH